MKEQKKQLRRRFGIEVDDRQFPSEEGISSASLAGVSGISKAFYLQIVEVPDFEIREWLTHVPNIELVRALIGAPDPVLSKIFHNLSETAVGLLKEDIDSEEAADAGIQASEESRRMLFELLCQVVSDRNRN